MSALFTRTLDGGIYRFATRRRGLHQNRAVPNLKVLRTKLCPIANFYVNAIVHLKSESAIVANGHGLQFGVPD